MKEYLGYAYFKDIDGLWKVVVGDSLFIVALDDSKINSNKIILASKNAEAVCKEYIEWLVN